MANLYQARDGVSIDASTVIAVRPLNDPTSPYSTEIVSNGGAGAHTSKPAAQIVAELAKQGRDLTLLGDSEAVDMSSLKGAKAWGPPADGSVSKFSFTGTFIAPDTGNKKEVWFASPFDKIPRDTFYEARPDTLISKSDIAAIRPLKATEGARATEIISIGGVGAHSDKPASEIVAELGGKGEKLVAVGEEAVRPDWVQRARKWGEPEAGKAKVFDTTVTLRNPANGLQKDVFLAAPYEQVAAAVKAKFSGPVRNNATHPPRKPAGPANGGTE
ncbi:MAG: hypothetical protein ACLP7P_09650 [Rhodomicrobium sp.]